MASVARKRVGTTGGTPLRVYGSPTTSTASTKDPYAAMVTKFTSQLKEIQDAEALKKLASGDDPQTFIDFAKKRVAEGDTSHDWSGLLKKAQDKVESDTWATDIKNGSKTLEDFKKHLEDKLAGVTAGSTDAQDILKNINDVQTSIKARDESARDQTALKAYIDSGDAKAYRDYMSDKLSRTTDPALQTKIVTQIKDLDTRISATEQVGRAQKVAQITSDYRDHKITASEATARLQDVAGDKTITAAEVNHIQTVSDSISKDAAARATAGSGGPSATGSGANQSLNAERTALEQAQNAIRDKLARNEPITQKDLDKVDAAASVVKTISEAIAADPRTAASTSRTSADEATKAAQAPMNIRNEVDQNTLQQFGFDTKSNTDFKATLAATTDPAEKAKLLIDRARDSQLALPKLLVPDNGSIVNGQGAVAYKQAQTAIQTLQKPAAIKAGSPEDVAIHQAYIDYSEAMNANKLPVMGESQWREVMNTVKTPEEANTALGIKPNMTIKTSDGRTLNAAEELARVFPDIIANTQKNNVTYNVDTGTYGGNNPETISNANTALDLSRQLLHVRYGNDTEFSPSDVASFATGNDPFAGSYDPTRDESMRARNRLADTGGSKVSPSIQDMSFDNMSSTAMDTVGAPIVDSSAPGGINSPDAQDRNSGFLQDQRDALFNPTDSLATANNYLDSGTNVDVGGWSLPDLPTFDPILPAYDATQFSQFDTPADNPYDSSSDLPPLPDVATVSGEAAAGPTLSE